MEFKTLGLTGLQVSQLCFGTMSFGGDANEEQSGRMYKACLDAGINFFDCADAYSTGKAETILGKLMRTERDDLIITSKCFNPLRDDINARGGNRRHILSAVEASLQRLGTDRLDVMFMHRWDAHVPLEETLRALEQLVSDGKVLYLGASNWSAWQIAKSLGITQMRGWPRIDVIQPMYSLVKRQVESEIFPLAQEENIGVITYSPVGGGLLSGKYGTKTRPNMGRIMDKQEYTDRYGEEWVFQVAEDFTALAKKKGHHPVSLAVAWAAKHPALTCPIIGARSLEQLQPSLNSVEIDMTDELHGEIAALSRMPAHATDRREEIL
jgi:aryl-alcohol dehydrogenase-like predicted oxidoreductase